MKTAPAFLLLLAQFWGLSAATGLAKPLDASEEAGLAIEQSASLIYPPALLYRGIFAGEVRTVVSVDENGRLTDCLVTAYTHVEFAGAAVAALKQWTYQPARVRGRAQASRADVVFVFRDHGVIVQHLPGALEHHAFWGATDDRFSYTAYQLRDLDHIPTPVHVVAPVVKGGGKETVMVEFYIDEEGKVRVPAVSRESAGDAYAAAAVAAVEQWRFEPPLRKGRPVLVYAQQEFNFRPKDKQQSSP